MGVRRVSPMKSWPEFGRQAALKRCSAVDDSGVSADEKVKKNGVSFFSFFSPSLFLVRDPAAHVLLAMSTPIPAPLFPQVLPPTPLRLRGHDSMDGITDWRGGPYGRSGVIKRLRSKYCVQYCIQGDGTVLHKRAHEICRGR